MYIYKTTKLITGKIYIGQSIRNIQNSFGYFGSGIYIKNALKKYGKDQFKKEILIEVFDQLWLDYYEEYYIKYFNSLIPNGYNIAKKSKGHGKWSDETKLKIGKTSKGRFLSDESKIKISNSLKGHFVSDKTKLKIRKTSKGRKHTKESKIKISNSLKGRIPWNKGLKNVQIISDETRKKLSNAGKNRKFSKKHKENLSKSLKGRILSNEWKEKIRKTIINNKKLLEQSI